MCIHFQTPVEIPESLYRSVVAGWENMFKCFKPLGPKMMSEYTRNSLFQCSCYLLLTISGIVWEITIYCCKYLSMQWNPSRLVSRMRLYLFHMRVRCEKAIFCIYTISIYCLFCISQFGSKSMLNNRSKAIELQVPE